MNNKKKSGSFYTPIFLADFLSDYLSDKTRHISCLSILEPSAGDGVFVKSISKNTELSEKISSFVVIEKNKRELEKVQAAASNKYIKFNNIDFLEYQKKSNSKFSIVVGNPPYIKRMLMQKKQIKICEKIHSSANLSKTSIKNIWTSFLVRGINYVDEAGVFAFVLPADLLQVKYAEELRNLIIKSFERVEIFTCNQLLFPDCKGQDTLVVVGEKKSTSPGVYYCNVNRADDFKKGKFVFTENVTIKDSKWTYHHLSSEEVELIEKLGANLNQVGHYCNSKAGIVTAANSFFIVDEAKILEYGLHNYVKPIIQKGVFVNGSVDFVRSDFANLRLASKPTYLLALNEKSTFRPTQKITRYLKLGLEMDLDKRYKMLKRKNWYEVPNIGSPPDAFFFKRCDKYPKLIKNSAHVLTTDSAYAVEMKANFDIRSLIYSFYNSLTLSIAELNGRYYGGGVLELTPNEFRRLVVPYVQISVESFKSYVQKFEAKESIQSVCNSNDLFILRSIDKNIDNDLVKKISSIREKLYQRRVKQK